MIIDLQTYNCHGLPIQRHRNVIGTRTYVLSLYTFINDPLFDAEFAVIRKHAHARMEQYRQLIDGRGKYPTYHGYKYDQGNSSTIYEIVRGERVITGIVASTKSDEEKFASPTAMNPLKLLGLAKDLRERWPALIEFGDNLRGLTLSNQLEPPPPAPETASSSCQILPLPRKALG